MENARQETNKVLDKVRPSKQQEVDKIFKNLTSAAVALQLNYYDNERFFDKHWYGNNLGMDNITGTVNSLAYAYSIVGKDDVNASKEGKVFTEEFKDTYKYLAELQWIAEINGYGVNAAARGFSPSAPLGVMWSKSYEAQRQMEALNDVLGLKLDLNKLKNEGIEQARNDADKAHTIQDILINGSKVVGMYHYDSLHEDYVKIGKLNYDDDRFPHYSFSSPRGEINAWVIMRDYHDGKLKTKEQVENLQSAKKNDNQQTESMDKKINDSKAKEDKPLLYDVYAMKDGERKTVKSGLSMEASATFVERNNQRYQKKGYDYLMSLPQEGKVNEKKLSEQNNITPNSEKDMVKLKEKKEVEQPKKTDTQKAEKPEKAESKSSAKKEDKKEDAKTEKSAEQKQGPRPPQMVTVNGDKVSHAHAFESNVKPDQWFFTARLNGTQLRPQLMDAADVEKYKARDYKVEDMMQKYYPTKLMKKVTPEEYKAANIISDGRKIDKMNVFKEKDTDRPDYGKYKLYAEVGKEKMATTLSKQDLNAFFDRVTTPAKLVEKNFGERLNLKSFYEQFRLPEQAKDVKTKISKDNKDGKWYVTASMEGAGKTLKAEVNYNDRMSFFEKKTATQEQIAAKYLGPQIKDLASQKAEKKESKGMKL